MSNSTEIITCVKCQYKYSFTYWTNHCEKCPGLSRWSQLEILYKSYIFGYWQVAIYIWQLHPKLYWFRWISDVIMQRLLTGGYFMLQRVYKYLYCSRQPASLTHLFYPYHITSHPKCSRTLNWISVKVYIFRVSCLMSMKKVKKGKKKVLK